MPKQVKSKNRTAQSRKKSTGLLPQVQSWRKAHGKTALIVFTCMAIVGFFYWRADSQAAPTAQIARSADGFVDTIGVNTHMHYPSYGNTAQIKNALVELGIRHVRDYPVDVAALTEFGQAGIKTSAMIAHTGQHFAKDFNFYWDGVKKLAPYLSTIENANEPDINFANRKADTTWPSAMREQQKRIWDTAKADPTLRNIPIAGPSLTWPASGSQISSGTVASDLGDISAWLDWGNAHPYPGDDMESHRVDRDMAATKQYNSKGKPVIMTETGYHNKIPDANGHQGLNEASDAIYMPRMYLHYYNLGVPRTYDYEFYDEDDRKFGWLRSDYSRKPVFHAVKNLITLLEDPGSSFTPGALSYELTGTDSTTQKTLLQKRDGSFWLAVWQQTRAWDMSGNRSVNPPNRTLTLNLANTASAIRTYMPNRGTSVINSASNTKTFSFESSEEVTLIQIGGVAVSPPPIDPNPPTPPPTTTAPDLVITSLTPTTATAGQPISFQATIKNQGTAATPAGTIHGVAFRVDGTLVNWNDVHTTSLAPGASVTLTATGGPSSTATWTPPATGTVTVEAYVDDINRIPGELDETNNKLTTTVTVTATTTTKPGDANGDGVVNAFDLSIVLSNFGTTGKTRALGNVDGDAQGNVNGLDLSLILTNYGK